MLNRLSGKIKNNSNILALDPSLSCTGWAVFSADENVFPVCNKYSPKKKITKNDSDTDDRILDIVTYILSLARTYSIKEVILEDGFIGASKKTGLQLAQLRGAIIYGLMTEGYKVCHMYPSEIRKAFGLSGNAKKDEVAKAVCKMYNGIENIIGPYSDQNNKKKTSDIYDAISIGVAYRNEKAIKSRY